MSCRTPPDDQDTMVCDGCSTIVQGKQARRHFARHGKTCGNVQIVYGWVVRVIGRPELRGLPPQ